MICSRPKLQWLMRRKVQDSILILGCNNILKEPVSLIRQQNLVWILGGSMTGQAWRLSYWGGARAWKPTGVYAYVCVCLATLVPGCRIIERDTVIILAVNLRKSPGNGDSNRGFTSVFTVTVIRGVVMKTFGGWDFDFPLIFYKANLTEIATFTNIPQ